jgi:methionyl-tRNA formyltransferase
MKILYLSEEINLKFISFLKKRGTVSWMNNRVEYKKLAKFDWIVSYGYRYIISSEKLKKLKNNIINLHISYLPYNRGSNPNYWSFKDRTPKGVTIHFIDEGIDTGPILVQKQCSFDKTHTLESSYNILKETVEVLFYDSFDDIVSGKIQPKLQKGIGSVHYKKDLTEPIDYKLNINKI